MSQTVRRFAALLFVVSLFAVSVRSQSKDDKISLNERVFITSKIYAAIPMYFGHFQAVPDFNLDAEYKKYLEQALTSDDRVSFDLATLEFFAKLKNGHSGFEDEWFYKNDGQPLGFYLTPIGNEWTVTDTSLDTLAIGEVVESIDNVPMRDFVRQKLKYVSASSETGQILLLFASSYLFPNQFTLKLKSGKTVVINRREQKLKDVAPRRFEGKMLSGNVAYIYIPSFDEPQNEQKAVEFIKQNAATAKALIIDVRDNGGGSTPNSLLRSLLDRPYRDWTTSTPLNVGVFGAYKQLQQIIPPENLPERERGYIEGVSEYGDNSQLLVSGALVKPEKPIFTKPLMVLINNACASACEDFVMPLKTSKRARVIGQTTYGSSGQPFMYKFDNGMSFQISTKRMYFPDGSQFEGVGIAPDVPIALAVNDLRTNKDAVLTKALELIGTAK